MGTLAGHDHGRQQDAGRRGRLFGRGRNSALCLAGLGRCDRGKQPGRMRKRESAFRGKTRSTKANRRDRDEHPHRARKRETKHRGKTRQNRNRARHFRIGARQFENPPRQFDRTPRQFWGAGGTWRCVATRVNRAGPSEARMGGRGGDRGKHPHKMKSAKAWIAAKRGDRGK